jgi:transitional endoplasmic reticulum ATPase
VCPGSRRQRGSYPPRRLAVKGPPGTGKTTFAKGVASRLGWPFVELFPSRLAGESSGGLAAALREAFALVAELDKVVLFIDEVDEIAGMRQRRISRSTRECDLGSKLSVKSLLSRTSPRLAC